MAEKMNDKKTEEDAEVAENVFSIGLPCDVLEMIFSFIPFPMVLKVLRLSKYWYGLFRSEHFFLTAAQKAEWPMPGRQVMYAQTFMGFHKASAHWLPLWIPPVSVRHFGANRPVLPALRRITTEGSFVCKLEKPEGRDTTIGHVYELSTGESRKFAWPLLFAGDANTELMHAQVRRDKSGDLRILIVWQSHEATNTGEYNITRNFWSRCTWKKHEFRMLQNSIFFEGKFYFLVTNVDNTETQFWTFDGTRWEDCEVWMENHQRFVPRRCLVGGGIFCCGSRIIVLTLLGILDLSLSKVFVELHELEPHSKRLIEWRAAYHVFHTNAGRPLLFATSSDESVYISTSPTPVLEACEVWSLSVKDMVADPALRLGGHNRALWKKASFQPGSKLLFVPDRTDLSGLEVLGELSD